MGAFRSINPFGVATQGVNGIAPHDASSTMNAMVKARILQGQLQYQQRLAELHGNLFQSQANLDEARRLEIGQKMVQNRSITDLASIVGKSQQLKKSLQTAAFGNDPATTISAYQLLQQRGVPFTPSTPENPQFTSRGDLMDMLSGVATGATSEIAAQQPGGAAAMLRPYSAGKDTALYTSLGDLIGMGPTSPEKPIITAPNASVYNPADKTFTQAPGRDIQPKMVNVNGHLVDTSQIGPDGMAKSIYDAPDEPFSLTPAVPKALDFMSGGDRGLKTNLVNKILMRAGDQLDRLGSDGAKAKIGVYGAPKSLDATTAKQFLQQAGGDKDKARQMAKDAGYTF